MKYARILAEIAATPWAIEHGTGRQLFDLLSRRLSGDPARAEDLAAAAEIRAARDQRREKAPPRGVSVIPVYGPLVKRADVFAEVSGLASTEQISQWVEAAAADPNIEAVVLDVDSPGGSVFGTAELAAKVAAAGKKKKVIAVANATAASAAYWIASQASELVVTPSGWVGSIGVVMTHVDESEKDRRAGVTVTVVASSDRKAAGMGPLNAAGRAEKEEHVAGIHDQFVRAVATGRKVSQAVVREKFGDGGMVLADRAVRLGMADRVATLDEVLARYGMGTGDLRPVNGGRGGRAEVGGGASFKPDVEIRKRKLRLAESEAARRTVPPPSVNRKPLPPSAPPAPYSPPTDGRNAEDDRRVALHEAGHAVVALALGGGIDWVTVNDGPDNSGSIMVTGLKGLNRLAMLYSGPAAEGVAIHGDDARQAADVTRDRQMCDVAYSTACDLLDRHPKAVAALADSLQERRTMGGADVAALCRPLMA